MKILKEVLLSLRTFVQNRVQRVQILYHRILSDPLAFRYTAIFAVVFIISFLISVLAYSHFKGRSFVIPLFDLELSAGTLIFSVRALLLFLLGAALFGSFSFKQAAAEWNSSVPFSVALLRGAVEAKHVDGVYTGSTLALVVIVGGTFGDPFSGLTLLLLWELFFLLQLIFYHFHNPEYGIPALYASYIVPRGKRLLLSAVITATGYTVSELGKMKIHDMGETHRSILRDNAFVEVNTEKTRVKYDFENNKLKTKYEFKAAVAEVALEREKIALENNKIALEREKLKARNSSWWPRSSDLKTD